MPAARRSVRRAASATPPKSFHEATPAAARRSWIAGQSARYRRRRRAKVGHAGSGRGQGRLVAREVAELSNQSRIQALLPVRPFDNQSATFDLRGSREDPRGTPQQAGVQKSVKAWPGPEVVFGEAKCSRHDPAATDRSLHDQVGGIGQKLRTGLRLQRDAAPGCGRGKRLSGGAVDGSVQRELSGASISGVMAMAFPGTAGR